jgi:hypothetical protein
MTDDRLPDWAYTEYELQELDQELLDGKYEYNSIPEEGMIVILSIWSKNGNTGKVMIVESTDVIETMNALNRRWADTGLRFNIVGYSGMTYGSKVLVDAIRTVLLPYRYETKFPTYILARYVYRYEPWMLNLISKV